MLFACSSLNSLSCCLMNYTRNDQQEAPQYSGSKRTNRLGFDELLLSRLVLLLESDVLLVEGQHTLLDVFWHVLAR